MEQAPRLVLRFAVLTALGLAAAGAAILMVVRHGDTVQAEQHAIDRARFAVEAVIRKELRAEDVATPVVGIRRQELDDLFVDVLLDGNLRASLYGSGGLITYSTDHRLIGTPATATLAREAMRGKVVSHLAGGSNGSPRVLETFVPVVLGADGSPGAVALEQDYGPIAAEADQAFFPIAGVLEVVLVLLFATLVPVLARVSRRIRRHVAELEYVASHDDLTGLPNRRGFRRALRAVGGGENAAVIVVELDGIAEINDALGHAAGDALLVEAAARLQSEAGEASVVARLGGDDFGLLMRANEGSTPVAFARRIHDALVRPYVVDGVKVAVGAHAGVALLPEHGTDSDVLVRCATLGAEVAGERQTGVEVYDPTGEATDVARLALAAELREAIANGQLVLHYQPQADLQTGVVRGVEALVRWQHPERGLLGPGAFVPLAERSGLVKELGRFVLEESARQWRAWQRDGLELDMSVNLTAVDLLDLSLPDQVADTLRRHEMPASSLVIEVTETTIMGDPRRTGEVLERLRSAGVRLAIDDFGTGYSSLAYLCQLPVHEVKVDRAFVTGIPDDTANAAILRCTVELAHGLGLEVVAEGVETHEQWACLVALGCDLAQGYLLARPLPADELAALANRRANPVAA
jgi:diguanylate cyclase (GGDEF)-like protein